VPSGTGRPVDCPACKSRSIHRAEEDRGWARGGGPGRHGRGRCGRGASGQGRGRQGTPPASPRKETLQEPAIEDAEPMEPPRPVSPGKENPEGGPQ
jgi:hypothetical protein